MVKETLPGPAWGDPHQLALLQHPGQGDLGVGAAPEVCGEHLEAREVVETPVNHGEDLPAGGEVDPGHQAQVVHRDRAVVPDDDCPSLARDVLQANDCVTVPQSQVTCPQLGDKSRERNIRSTVVVSENEIVGNRINNLI